MNKKKKLIKKEKKESGLVRWCTNSKLANKTQIQIDELRAKKAKCDESSDIIEIGACLPCIRERLQELGKHIVSSFFIPIFNSS